MNRPLLILDIDETLVCGKQEPLLRECDFWSCDYFIYLRPHVREFLLKVSEFYDLACWSSATADYLEAIIYRLFVGLTQPLFVWDRSRCTRFYDHFDQRELFVKDLSNLEKGGFELERVLLLDDNPSGLQSGVGNAIFVEPYRGALEDDELVKLLRYLLLIRNTKNFCQLEKTKWRSQLV